MKKLSWFNKIFFFLTIVLTIATFLAYVLPFLAPKLFPFLSVLTLFLPMIQIVNVLFFIYWFIQFKRQVVLPTIVLLVGLLFLKKFYKTDSPALPDEKGDFKIMSYNVRLFNKFEWSEKKTIPIEISDFVKDKDPDILCIQEFSSGTEFDTSNYKYKHLVTKGDKIKLGMAIFSKYKIVNQGDLAFPHSDNNTIFADIKKGNDTLRVYCMHLQSVKISPDVQVISDDLNKINEKKSEEMFKMLSVAFKEQQIQAEIITNHKSKCKYPIIIAGDMNNSAFSYVYRIIKGDLKDSFEEAGVGFGKSYDFNYYPARIDYIFAPQNATVKRFENYTHMLDSDHFPVMAVINMKKNEIE
jgi:endonuclease/exonuclease/phosphatase family metal-dependent hydrolase